MWIPDKSVQTGNINFFAVYLGLMHMYLWKAHIHTHAHTYESSYVGIKRFKCVISIFPEDTSAILCILCSISQLMNCLLVYTRRTQRHTS